ncbi:hypothetical protein N9850_14380 [Granulosicoccus sp.]|nr:hypothetical protein [Granulosicoccus sp.]MDB4224948.1 hypothetical protein [Granulosicoccus sp.]
MSSPNYLLQNNGQFVAARLFKKLGSSKSIRLNKRHQVLLWLTMASEIKFHVTRFDAEMIGDHVLNSTIPQIEKYDRLRIERIWTIRNSRFGKPVRCCEYWLSDIELVKGKQLLRDLIGSPN